MNKYLLIAQFPVLSPEKVHMGAIAQSQKHTASPEVRVETSSLLQIGDSVFFTEPFCSLEQEMFHNGNYAETTLDAAPNWQRLAQAYDINYVCIENLDDAAQKLAVVFNDDEPYLIDLLVDHTANVYPMVPAGCGLDEIVGDFENEA